MARRKEKLKIELYHASYRAEWPMVFFYHLCQCHISVSVIFIAFFLFVFFGVYNPLGQLYGHDIWRCNHIAIEKNIIGPLIQNAWGCFCSTEHTFTSTSRSSEYVIYSCPGLVPLFLNKLNCFPSLLLWCCWSNLTWNILVVCEKISVCV